MSTKQAWVKRACVLDGSSDSSVFDVDIASIGVYVIVEEEMRGWELWRQEADAENVVVEVLGVFHVNPFLHAASIDLVTTGTWYSAHKVACLVMITLPGEALSLGRKTRGPSSDLVAQWCCISLRAAQWWYGFLPRPARSRAVSFLSSSGSNSSNSTQASLQTACSVLFVGRCRPPHAMPCNASIARAVAYRQGKERGIWRLSR